MGREEERDCLTTARGTESSEGESEEESRSSRMLGSWGGMGDRTQRFEEYFVRMKFSILESEGMWEGGKDASQYLPSARTQDIQTILLCSNEDGDRTVQHRCTKERKEGKEERGILVCSSIAPFYHHLGLFVRPGI